MSNRRNNNYSTSSSSSPSSSDFTSKKNNINEEINNESDTFNRPLSLYDNLNALVASLKPPGIHESKYLENYNKNITNHNNNNNSNNSNKNSSGNVSNNNYRNNSATVNNYSNNNNNSSDLLYNVNQEDFIFSDIKFNFPKIPIRSNYSDGNNDNDRDVVKIKNGAKKMTSNSNNHHHHNHQQHHNSNNNNNNNNNNNIQYVNLDATIGSKPVHSDAKSSFFGLNNGIHTNDRNSYNDKTKPTTSPSQQILHSTIPNGHDSNNIDNDDADDDGDDDNTLITITNVQSTTINIQKRKNRNSNEEDDGGCGVAGADDDDDDNNNNNNGGDSNDCDEEKNFIDSSESQQKQVTYITPEKYGYDNKPSQAVYMATTVPQNIKGNNIMGRHTPTRNSLRHSRMLVVNKHFQGGFEKSNPMNLQCPGLLRLLLIIALLSGILLTSLALWIKIWAPNTRFQDNPYWSGIVLIICSIISLKLLNFKRAARNNFRKICFKVLKINSIIFSVAAVILSLIAFVFAFIHFKNLWHVDDHCIPSKLFTETSECLCIFGVAADYTDHRKFKNPENIKLPSGGYTFHYKDLSCREVRDAWRYIVLASLIINLIGFLAIVFYLFIFFFKAKKRKHQTNITVNRMSSLNIA